MKPNHRLINRIKTVWDYLTTPHPSITDVERRKQSQLLAEFAITLTFITLLSGVFTVFYFWNISGVLLFLAGITVTVLVFAFNRRGYYVSAARLMVIGFYTSIHLSLLSHESATIYYAIHIFLLSGIFLSLRTSLILAAVSILLQSVAQVVNPITLDIERIDPLVFTIVSALVIAVFIIHRRTVAQAQQAELRASNVALHESEARWRSLVENAPDFIIEIDLNLKIRFVNTLIPSLKPEDVLGKHIDTFVAPEYKNLTTRKVKTVIETSQPVEYEVEGINAEETLSWYSNMVNPILRDGKVIGVIMISRDISVRKQAESERLAYQLEIERVRALEELIGNLSHDLKTPLGTIRFSLSMLEQLPDPTQQQVELETIRHQAARLERLIQNILIMSRLDHIPELHQEHVDLNAIARNVVQTVRPTAAQKNVTTHVELRDPFTLVVGDETELDRAIANLVENALNYTPNGGTITIKTYNTNGHSVIEVTDTGIGISDEDLPKIFERFFRSSNARQSRKGGTGLGLAIVRRIIEMHNGKIEVESKIGKGTTFRVMLPAATRTGDSHHGGYTNQASV